MINKIVLSFLIICGTILSQDINLVPYLKDIEAGKAEEVRAKIPQIQRENPGSVNLRFLQAILTENGEEALTRYEQFYIQHPKNAYADAALYRVFSYYYSLGIYNKAQDYLDKLKDEYPRSPYIKAADRKIPDEIETDKPEEKVVYTPPPPPPVQKKERPRPLPPVREEDGKFTVQAGAFLNAGNAGELVKKIEKDGYKCSIYQKNVGGSILNVITVGSLQTKDDGAAILAYLKSRFNLNGRVVEKSN